MSARTAPPSEYPARDILARRHTIDRDDFLALLEGKCIILEDGEYEWWVDLAHELAAGKR